MDIIHLKLIKIVACMNKMVLNHLGIYIGKITYLNPKLISVFKIPIPRVAALDVKKYAIQFLEKKLDFFML